MYVLTSSFVCISYFFSDWLYPVKEVAALRLPYGFFCSDGYKTSIRGAVKIWYFPFEKREHCDWNDSPRDT